MTVYLIVILTTHTLFSFQKIHDPVRSSDFWPINLCNVIYKIMSKVIVNRLNLILFAIISSHQSAFIPRRLITNNVIVAYEALHPMKTLQKSRVGHIAIKLDISKNYDRVE